MGIKTVMFSYSFHMKIFSSTFRESSFNATKRTGEVLQMIFSFGGLSRWELGNLGKLFQDP